MRTFILAQIPNPDISTSITRDQLSLVRVDDHVVDGSNMGDQVSRRSAMDVIALDATRSCIPDLDRTVFGAGHHPFALAMKRHAGDVAAVAIEGEDWVGVRGADVIELHILISRRGQVAFIRGDAESVDLRF